MQRFIHLGIFFIYVFFAYIPKASIMAGENRALSWTPSLARDNCSSAAREPTEQFWDFTLQANQVRLSVPTRVNNMQTLISNLKICTSLL